MLPFGFTWFLKIHVSIPYSIKKSGNILVPALPTGGIHGEMKAGDSGKRRVRINGHFFVARDVLFLVFKNSKGDRRTLKEANLKR